MHNEVTKGKVKFRRANDGLNFDFGEKVSLKFVIAAEENRRTGKQNKTAQRRSE